MESNNRQAAHNEKKPNAAARDGAVRDPVCGMVVDPKTAKGGSSQFQGQNYFFCSQKCKSKFAQEPLKYLQVPPKSEAMKNDEFTCPMHPEIRQMGPGSCPICGMALEPVTISMNPDDDNLEYYKMRTRFWVSTFLSLPLIFVTMGGRHFIQSQQLVSVFPWIELLLASPVVLWCGWPFYLRFWQSIKNRSLNMFTLIGLGIAVAYIYSLIAVFFPQFFPPSFRDSMTGEVGL